MFRERRNNSLAGVLLLLGALLTAFGAARPWAQITINALNLKALKLDLSAVPQLSADAGNLQAAVFGAAALMGVSALLLIGTRARGLSVIWRVAGLLGVLGPALLTYYLWAVALGDPAKVLDDPSASTLDKTLGIAELLLSHAGLITISPGQGLYAMTAGAVVALIGCFMPGSRGREQVALATPEPAMQQVPAAPAGWYPVNDGQRYWDGRGWTDHFNPT
jgi:hypothetical protein